MTDITEPVLAPEPQPRRSNGRMVGLGVAIVAVIAGAVFAAFALANNGGNNPDDPVKAMFEAAQRGDALGIMEQLDPGERDALRGPLQDVTRELNRLRVLSGADLSHLTGYELKVENLDLQTTKVRDDLAHVAIKNGTSAYKVDPDKLPLGTFVRDLAGDKLKDSASSGTGDLKTTGDDTGFVTTVKRGDRWYVSIGYSVAEVARQDRGVDIKDIGDGVVARGADTPQDAVRDLLTAATKLDVRRAIELMPPDEMGALQSYAGMFIRDAEMSANDAREQFNVTFPTLELDSATSGNQSLVTVTKFSVSGTVGGAQVTYKDGCFDATPPPSAQGASKPMHLCQGSNPLDALQQFGGTGGAANLPPAPDFSFKGKRPKVGIMTVKVDGTWYVSPTRTFLDDLVATLKLVQPSDLDKGRDWFTSLARSFGLNINAD